MKNVARFAALICVFAFVFFIVQYSYLGLTSFPTEVDSITYHLPIARHIREYGWWSIPQLPMGLGYYPAVGETILALFLFAGERFANLYNVAGIISVFVVSVLLGRSFRLRPDLSIVFATAAVLLNPAMRLVNNQTVDIWFQFFALLSIFFLNTLSGEKKNMLFAGLSLGLLTGTKYSGPLAVLFIIFVFRDRLRPYFKQLIVRGIIPFFLLGGFWYFRNFILTGNPFYPGNIDFMGFKLAGDPTNRLTDWMPIKTILFLPGGLIYFFESLISEYSVWLVLIGFFFIHLFRFGKTKNINRDIRRLVLLGLAWLLIFLITPSWPKNFVSDLRYTLPGMTLLILAFFVYFAKRWPFLPLMGTVLSLIFNFPLLTHHPKINALLTIPLIFLLSGVSDKSFR